MSGIYLHIPFCKQACHYCDFHFSTSLRKKEALVAALCTEIRLRKDELNGPVETIYFGGGTPSLLTAAELTKIFDCIYTEFTVSEEAEITLEANPDDLSEMKLEQLAASPINRLSIGVQSFFEKDLRLMNRAHDAAEAHRSIEMAKRYFSNISIDLIYGIPDMGLSRWQQNVETALALGVPHLSCYALTVEPKTALKSFIEKGVVAPVDDVLAQQHHAWLLERTERSGFENYEFSNFGLPGFHSRNNMAYWQGKPYLGVGPSAHSYSGTQRSWNVANNAIYLKKIAGGILPLERENLSLIDRYNEYVMTRLRTAKGISLSEISEAFGARHREYLEQQAQQHLVANRLERVGEALRVTRAGKFLSDGIASDLFLIDLKG
ncbi:MAG: coproporphyrinogen III oxidase [Flavobacteriaceae bacterium]|nr:coproporphyrinogen III oxidase [Flavobacteriaceae bacterium]